MMSLRAENSETISAGLDGAGCHGEYFPHIESLLPRYVRVIGHRQQHPVPVGSGDIAPPVAATEADDDHSIVHRVAWAPEFIALPGYTALSELSDEDGDYRDKGLFPMDIASALAVYILMAHCSHISNSSSSSRSEGIEGSSGMRILDMCCCPGAKFQLLSEMAPRGSLLVGVDLSEQRLEVCKSLLRTWHRTMHKVSSTGTAAAAAVNSATVSSASLGDATTTNIASATSTAGDTTASAAKTVVTASSPVRQLIFCADGTKFRPTADQLGRLVFDSEVLLRESDFISGLRKKVNKSAKKRDQRQLSAVQSQLIADLRGDQMTTGSRVAAIVEETTTPTTAVKEEDIAAAVANSRALLAGDFDVILVDAECTHDASYRHMKYIPKGTTTVAAAAAEDGSREIEAVVATTTAAAAVGVKRARENAPTCFESTAVEAEEDDPYGVGSDIGFFKPGARLSHSSAVCDINCSTSSNNCSLSAEATNAATATPATTQVVAVAANDVSALTLLQRGLLHNAFSLLRPGGHLVYSTCTHAAAQNEEIVQWLLDCEPTAVVIDADAEIDSMIHRMAASSGSDGDAYVSDGGAAAIGVAATTTTSSSSSHVVSPMLLTLQQTATTATETTETTVTPALSWRPQQQQQQLAALTATDSVRGAEFARQLCAAAAKCRRPRTEKGRIRGCVCVGSSGAMSGHFIAKIQKKINCDDNCD